MYVPRTRWEKLSRKGLKMLFIHTPKCGGSFVGKSFAPYWRRCISLRAPELAGHLTYNAYRDGLQVLGQPIDGFTTFSIVRNPFDWHVSWFSYIRGPKGDKRSGYALEHALFQKMEFPDYVDWLCDPDAERTPQFDMGKGLWQWVGDAPRQIKVDTVLRQEHLHQDLTALKEQHGLMITLPTKQVNASKREGGYRKYYTPEAVDKIAEFNAVDCEMFDYRFEP